MSTTKSMRDALYEEPGPKTRRKMLAGTVLSSPHSPRSWHGPSIASG